MSGRSVIAQEKPQLIVDAVVRVLARRGFHTCRLDDISAEADARHALVFQSFAWKDGALETVFVDAWNLLDANWDAEASRAPVREQSRQVAP